MTVLKIRKYIFIARFYLDYVYIHKTQLTLQVIFYQNISSVAEEKTEDKEGYLDESAMWRR